MGYGSKGKEAGIKEKQKRERRTYVKLEMCVDEEKGTYESEG